MTNKETSWEMRFKNAWEDAYTDKWRHPADGMRVFFAKEISKAEQEAVENYRRELREKIEVMKRKLEGYVVINGKNVKGLFDDITHNKALNDILKLIEGNNLRP